MNLCRVLSGVTLTELYCCVHREEGAQGKGVQSSHPAAQTGHVLTIRSTTVITAMPAGSPEQTGLKVTLRISVMFLKLMLKAQSNRKLLVPDTNKTENENIPALGTESP